MLMLRLVFAGMALLLAVVAANAAEPGEAALRAIFGDPASGPLPLAPATAAVMPEGKVRAALGRLVAQYGPLQTVVPNGSAYLVRLATADLTVRLALDQAQQIRSLLVTSVIPQDTTLATFVAAVSALPGRRSVLVTRDGQTLYAHDADVPLAVASAFKLVVLQAVMDAVASGRLAWNQVVTLDPARRALPTGFLQDWPEGTPVTISTLTDAMISVSDNTAADTLAHLVGTAALDALSPRNAPFLSTRTMMTLRSGALEEAARNWRTLDIQARQALVGQASGQPLPDAESVRPGGFDGAEWYISATELCGLLARTHDVPAFQINPGPASRGDWRSVAFKGGSDEGVLNLSVLATSHEGQTVCVAVTWNGPDVSLDRLLGPVTGLLHAMAHGSEGGLSR